MHSSIKRFAPEQFFLGHRKGYLQAVRFDRFDTETLRKGDAAYIHVDIPRACRCIGFSRHIENIKSCFTFCLCLAQVELAERIVKFHDDRMISWEHPAAVVQHKAEMQRVARTPYTAVAVDEALDAFLHDFSGDIEGTQRKGGTVVYTKIRALLSEGSSQIERLAVFQRETHLPFVVRHAGS